MGYEQGFYLKIKGFVDAHKAGKTSLDDFADQIERSYAFKQKGRSEVLAIFDDEMSQECIPEAIEKAQTALEHLDEGFDLLFGYIETLDARQLDAGLTEIKRCTAIFNEARDLALDWSEDAGSFGVI